MKCFASLVRFAAVTSLLFIACTGEPVAPESSTLPTTASTAAPTIETPSLTASISAPGPLGKLAYVQGGDIWVKDLLDGEPRRLTHDGNNHEPRWSPSGEWLAFRKVVSRSGPVELWVMSADGGKNIRLNQGDANIGWFKWSSTGDRIAFISSDTGFPTSVLEVIDADGANRKQVAESHVGRFAWSPDGEWLAYDHIERRDELGTWGLPWRSASVWRVRWNGTEAEEVHNAGEPSSYGFVIQGWSSDASTILYRVDPVFSASALADGFAPLFAISKNGDASRQLVEQALLHADFFAPDPVPTDRIALIVGGYRATWTRKGLHLLSVMTGEAVAVTASDVAASSPAWSPDGQRLAYVAMPDNGDLGGGNEARLGMMDRRIYLIDANGSNQRQLTNDPAYRDERPLWSSDGSHILLARVNVEGNQGSLWLISTEGGQPRLVADGLTPTDKGGPIWFGYYGHITWDAYFDWWRGPS